MNNIVSWHTQKLMRSAAKHLLLLPRMLHSRYRALPDYLIIGAQKSGTTSLYSYLIQHPSILAAFHKEVHFFDLQYDKGVSWYRSHFPKISSLKKAGAIVGEASPYYLFHPHSARRIYDLIPHVKLILLLRNPSERAVSHYFHERRHGTESLSIQDAFNQEDIRIADELKRMVADPHYQSPAHQRYSYLRRGIYAGQIETYLEFFPAENMLILKAEDFFSNPAETVKKTYRFLAVDDSFVPSDLKARNIGQRKAHVDENVYQFLDDYYAEHNERLYKLLGKDLRW